MIYFALFDCGTSGIVTDDDLAYHMLFLRVTSKG